MVQVMIKGVEVDFPFNPYACQVAYMEKVISCLKEGKNGILESPTGTGKTLCLLCAALAWRATYAASLQLSQNLCKDAAGSFGKQLQDQLESASGSKSEWNESGASSVPKIVYASRTHSQLTQAVGELKNTIYRPKVTVLGSRDQLCINPEVNSQDTNTAKVHMCRTKVNAKTCGYYNNVEAQKKNPEFSGGILDIEDMVNLGNNNRVCPYYMSRELKSAADIIFMPYNYLLDNKTRMKQSIDLNNTILLIDEAHNVESVCERSSSFDLTSLDIATCIEDCDQCIRILQEAEKLEQQVDTDISADEVAIMKAFFLKFEKTISEIRLIDGKSTEPGGYIYHLLETMNITKSTSSQVLDAIDKCNAVLASQGPSMAFGKRAFALQKFGDVLKVVFSQDDDEKTVQVDRSENSKFYKVHVHATTKTENKNVNVWLRRPAVAKEERTLSYWCFNPGITMKELMRQGVRSLILTSGTLSPIDSFKAELDVPFDIHLENPHVIDKNQIFVGVLPQGPDGADLCSSYQMRSDEVYQNSLGNAICNLSNVIPHGILVFFPSYPVMDQCIKQWQQEGIWQRLAQKKEPFIESRGKGAFNEAMEDFYKAIENPEKRGAIFFAVCRGKVSEGLDFANNNGRAVIITGLPFPPRMDDRVVLKMQYLNDARSRGSWTLNGNTWYRQQASRAVNQAVGRVIRHRRDYGAILLLDKRFASKDSISQLPKWLRNEVRVFRQFGDIQRETAVFFRRVQQSAELSNMRTNGTITPASHDATQQGKQTASSSSVSLPNVRMLAPPKVATSGSSATATTKDSKAYNKEATHSLAVLKAGSYAAPNKGLLLDQLMTYEGKNENHSAQPEASNENISVAANAEKKSETFQKKTNFRIVMPKKDRSSKKQTSRKTKRYANAREYVDEAKLKLDGSSYEKLKIAVSAFPKDHAVPKLIQNLTEAFNFRPELFALFKAFGQFLRRPEDKDLFEKVCQEYQQKTSVTECDAEESASDAPEQPSSKRTKLDFLVKEDEKAEQSSTSSDQNRNRNCEACSGRLLGPYKGPCGHICCCECWDKSIRETHQCLLCLKPVKKKQLQRVFFP